MRLTVLLADLAIFFPAVFFFACTFRRTNISHKKLSSAIGAQIGFILLQPSFVLVDHGHFQYNCVSLGFALLSCGLILRDRPYVGTAVFCLALCYKQIALYYAPAFFFYLLAQAIMGGQWPYACQRVIKLGFAAITTLLCVFLPFLFPSNNESFWEFAGVRHVLFRVFPFTRGIFEDKVSNFWCISNLVVKWKSLYSGPQLAQLSLCLTLFALIPVAISAFRAPLLFSIPSSFTTANKKLLFLRPSALADQVSAEIFVRGVAVCALGFYLFAFQVHEKGILFPLLFVSCLWEEHPTLVVVFCYVATFSMYPLLLRDGLCVAFFATQALYVVLVPRVCAWRGLTLRVDVFYGIVVTSLGVHTADAAFPWAVRHVTVLESLPHLPVLLFACFSFVCFFSTWLVLSWSLCTQPRALTTSLNVKEEPREPGAAASSSSTASEIQQT
jgi:alpha-1,3-glucosyltransferase